MSDPNPLVEPGDRIRLLSTPCDVRPMVEAARSGRTLTVEEADCLDGEHLVVEVVELPLALLGNVDRWELVERGEPS